VSVKGLDAYSTYVFDLDGCLHFADRPALGAAALVEDLKRRGKRTLFLSNNSTHRPMEMQARLASMGIHAEREHIFLASTLAGRYLMDRFGASRVCVAGTSGLALELAAQGHDIVPLDGDAPCDMLVVGRDLDFSFERLRQCSRRVLNGAALIATNPDPGHPDGDGGLEPETGALAAAVAFATGGQPTFLGKPHPYAFARILDDFGLAPDECLMIGDNLETDILGARRMGMDTCWLDARQEDAPHAATHRFATLIELHGAISGRTAPHTTGPSGATA